MSDRFIDQHVILSADSILEANIGEFEAVVIIGRRRDGSSAVASTHGVAVAHELMRWASDFVEIPRAQQETETPQ